MAEPARARVTLAELLAVLSLATDLGMGQPMEHVLRQCLIALRLAGRLGLAQRVRDSVAQTFERWDGKGVPKGARGEEILLAARLVALADVVEVFHRAGGVQAAVSVARQRRGTQFDPAIVDVFVAGAAALCAGLDDTGTWDAVLTAEPARGAALTGQQAEPVLAAIATSPT